MAITVTLQTKNPTSLTQPIKQGVDPRIDDIQNLTFNDALLPDGTKVKNTTFQQLQNTTYSYPSKNVTTLTDVSKP